METLLYNPQGQLFRLPKFIKKESFNHLFLKSIKMNPINKSFNE